MDACLVILKLAMRGGDEEERKAAMREHLASCASCGAFVSQVTQPEVMVDEHGAYARVPFITVAWETGTWTLVTEDGRKVYYDNHEVPDDMCEFGERWSAMVRESDGFTPRDSWRREA